MENKNVGYMILGIAVLLIVIIFLYNNALKEIIVGSCGIEHAVSCPMTQSVNQQTYLALGIVGLLIIVSFILMFSKPYERLVFKTRTIKTKPEKKIFDTKGLKSEEKQVLSLIQNNKTIFQADLIEKTGLGKAKMTRIIDRLEGKGFVERKRRGLTNVVVLKD